MSSVEEFEANLVSLSHVLQKKYALLRDLDKSLQEIQRQNEQRCEREIEEIRKGIRAGPPDTALTRFSDEALDEQKHSIRIADEKVALAMQAYDLVDMHVQQLDQYLKKSDEEMRREKEAAAPSSNVGSSGKAGRSNESGRGGRKKTRLATANAVAAAASTAATAAASASAGNPSGMDLDLPVDPNEPTYCICNQVSYGEMIACDNNECKIEWFHFGCVGLKEQPKGKWYCPDCASLKNHRRKGR
ncbi:PREDICTED: PHD finger protein ING1 [Tarenaya hassleriana]|uniref:PHD finger protein ING1 n=1 Tax=Tarenaya hassleriana TaxID=28532 RepID=UPI00053C902E|nr:PREDICTED: PHD finger protein ING1 [Tarenaya hassleriana]